MIPLMYKQNMTTIGPVVSEITCLIKMDIDRQTETGDHFFRILEVMTRRENMKVEIRPMYSITILS